MPAYAPRQPAQAQHAPTHARRRRRRVRPRRRVVSLGTDWPSFRPRYGRAYSRDRLPGDEVVTLPARSALVLAGAARSRWMHGIDRRDTAAQRHRVSATFRTLA